MTRDHLREVRAERLAAGAMQSAGWDSMLHGDTGCTDCLCSVCEPDAPLSDTAVAWIVLAAFLALVGALWFVVAGTARTEAPACPHEAQTGRCARLTT